MSGGETYKLECYSCGETVEFPVDAFPKCPRCGMTFVLDWRPADILEYEKELLPVHQNPELQLTLNQHAEAEIS